MLHLDVATGLNVADTLKHAQIDQVKAGRTVNDKAIAYDFDHVWSSNSREDDASDNNTVVANVDPPGEENEGETDLPGETDGVSGVVGDAVPERSPDAR